MAAIHMVNDAWLSAGLPLPMVMGGLVGGVRMVIAVGNVFGFSTTWPMPYSAPLELLYIKK